ncbi:Rho GTPase, putative [Entamoeba invadens IP1]|uniref:Rho GTPase, putative n=1 Tax=Entamoeba invadens IP1 TaxID=370355 RepID=A0A0A1U0M7_ENTIV|nr:Rho GTPase, putative [Entamoeba invadens IP1]ELP87449.1 Rho GTPase, putative [Entamoeba invadens IP1]|eukprot:XP_004254220.1 Rho GTPase, putative [Entamoeba invadens IP1]
MRITLKISNWVQEYQNEQEIAYIIFVGNKTDLPPKVTVEQGEAMAREQGFQHMRCSAKTGEGVNEIFEALAKGIYGNKEIMAILPKKNNITVVHSEKDTNCC